MPLKLPVTPDTNDTLSYQGAIYAITNVSGPTISSDKGKYTYGLTTSAGVITCSAADTTMESNSNAAGTPNVWVKGQQ